MYDGKIKMKIEKRKVEIISRSFIVFAKLL